MHIVSQKIHTAGLQMQVKETLWPHMLANWRDMLVFCTTAATECDKEIKTEQKAAVEHNRP